MQAAIESAGVPAQCWSDVVARGDMARGKSLDVRGMLPAHQPLKGPPPTLPTPPLLPHPPPCPPPALPTHPPPRSTANPGPAQVRAMAGVLSLPNTERDFFLSRCLLPDRLVGLVVKAQTLALQSQVKGRPPPQTWVRFPLSTWIFFFFFLN